MDQQTLISNPIPKACNSIYRKVWNKYQLLTLNFVMPKSSGILSKSPPLNIYIEF